MMNSLDSEQLALDDLVHAFEDLRAALEAALDQLKGFGELPPETLHEKIVACRVLFSGACNSVQEVGVLAGVLSDSNAALPANLNELRALVADIEAIRKQRRDREIVLRRVDAVVDRVNAIRHVAEGVFAPLEECQERAVQMRTDVTDALATGNIEFLASLDTHLAPYEDILLLVDSHKNMEDDRWTELQDNVGRSFSRLLAATAARGKLVVPLVDITTIPQAEMPQPISDVPENDSTADHEKTITPDLDGADATGTSVTPPDMEYEPHNSVLMESTHVELEAASFANAPELGEANSPDAEPEPIERVREGETLPQSVAAGSFQQITLNPTIPVVDDATESVGVETSSKTLSVAFPDNESDREPSSGLSTPYSNDGSIREIARAIRTSGSSECAAMLTDLIWSLIRDDRLSVAYHIAQATEIVYPGHTETIPSSVIRALALNSHVHSSSGEALAHLDACAQALLEIAVMLPTKSNTAYDPLRILLFSLTLRPALLASRTQIAAVLEALPLFEMETSFLALREAILNYARMGLELSPSILKGVREHAAWVQDLDDLQNECLTWLTDNLQVKIIYAPTTEVWKRWVEPNGVIRELLEIVVNDVRTEADRVRKAVRDWGDMKQVYTWLASTDRELRGKLAERLPIEARAKKAVYQRSQNMVQLLKRWLILLDSEPNSPSNFQYQQADVCRSQVLSHLSGAIQSVDHMVTANVGIVMASAGTAVKNALEGVAQLFDASTANSVNIVPVTQILHQGLLYIPCNEMEEDWDAPKKDPTELLSTLIKFLDEELFDWSHAFERQMKTRDHLATRRILEVLETSPVIGIDHKQMQRDREVAIQNECRPALRDNLKNVRSRIERAVSYDLLAESTRLSLISKVESVHVESVLNFWVVEKQLDDVLMEIRQSETERLLQVRARLTAADIQERDADAYERIDRVLQAGDFLSANEYIDMVLAGQPIPESRETTDPFRDFFPGFAEDITVFLEGDETGDDRTDRRNRKDTGTIIRNIKQRQNVGPLNMRAVPGAQTEDAAQMLEAWYNAKARRDVKDSVRNILTRFGFNVSLSDISGPEWRSSDREWLADMQAGTISERSVCAIPQYGSLAAGRYKILCTWDRLSEDEILDRAGRQVHGIPVIVLYFGRMTEQRRRDLANLCRVKRQTVLVIDEALVFYLCQERGMRLPALFQCTFPFTMAHPYTTTAGLVPVEMFFGRERERESIIGLEGTNLVYGGRQLGKTALLRDVERRYHKPDNGFIVRWIDLKAEGIGINRPIEDIWAVLAAVLQREEIIKSQKHTPDGIKSQVEEWLAKNPRRRIVLLLDEADAFLESDSKKDARNDFGEGYAHLWRLKGIMDRTSRRFKVVFAGLHNVQRTSRDPNTPIAHMGTPLCIGPLLDNGEWREALALIVQPFTTLGYRFETDELPMRILSHTNYYPSLIQLFCKHLLDHLSNIKVTSFDIKRCPPYIITARHVEDAYQGKDTYQSSTDRSQELRKAILYRFTLTLDLDPRYRVIALLIAFASAVEEGERALIEGFDASWVRENALNWWNRGFEKDSSLEAFETILDEMIGLGVLRKVGGNRYALRSPNVLNLLGTQADILNALDSALKKDPPPVYEAEHFRRALREEPLLRSPLTAQQESVLLEHANSVSIVFGSRIAGLDDLLRSLRVEGREQHLVEIDNIMDLTAFRQQIGDIQSNQVDGLTVVVIAPSCSWDSMWVSNACDALSRKMSPRKWAQFVFVADPVTTWSWIQNDIITRKRIMERGVRELSLKPWNDTTLRRWLLDTEFGSDNRSELDRCQEVTGNWGSILQTIGLRCKANPHLWKRQIEELEQELVTDPVFLDRLGPIPEAMPIFRVMADIGEPMSIDDITGLVEDFPTALVEQVIRWADLLSFVQMMGHGKWKLDPVVSRIALQRKG